MDISRDAQPVSDARANLTELINSVRILRRTVLLTSRGKPVAAVVTAELGQLANELGGPDKLVEFVRAHRGAANG